ncbi:MAG: endolytic transglycosylase MltG, partial [Alphaproteobacteria bacterium]|nr:endolytic transglycosylase MltG [Alphaproteobacteria bacterium]
LQAGEYAFDSGMTMYEVMEKLRSGDTVVRRLTIPEGLSTSEILALVRAEPALSGEIEEEPEEGLLLPETYHFHLGDDRQGLVNRMKESMQEAITNLWPERQEGLPITSPYEAKILASIVEKETAVASERPHVAGVFINRLNLGMPLQSDPTVVYGITGGGPLGRPLRRSELDAETPYNTYQFRGLPPTPIANPGLASLKAVLDPLETKDLYFVADGTGGHAFAETYREHQRNVRKWRQLEREREAQGE